jgi:hypothetical protein
MFGTGSPQRLPGGTGVDLQAAEAICHGTRVNLMSHLVSALEYGTPLKGWSRIGVDGATYIYGFNKKELCLKVKYASPFMQRALANKSIPLHPLGIRRLPRGNQYFSQNEVSMKVVAYDDGGSVQVAPTSDILQVKIIDLDSFLSLLPPRRVVI